MAKKSAPVEKTDLEKMKDLKIFQSILVRAGGTPIRIVRVPGGYLYNGRFAWMDETMQKDLDQ